jgi:hypothetical protein
MTSSKRSRKVGVQYIGSKTGTKNKHFSNVPWPHVIKVEKTVFP